SRGEAREARPHAPSPGSALRPRALRRSRGVSERDSWPEAPELDGPPGEEEEVEEAAGGELEAEPEQVPAEEPAPDDDSEEHEPVAGEPAAAEAIPTTA